ncbi:MAG: response regulator transcription factor, partial [Bacteroidota bacterium]
STKPIEMIHKKINKLSIVEDQEPIMDFLVRTFEQSADFECLGKYKTAEEAIAFLPKSDTDVVIVDIGLPGLNGIECVKQVKSLRPDIQFIMYTVFDRDNEIFESLKSGASGYLVKSTKREAILSAVRELVAGGAPMSPAIARKVTDFFFSGRPTGFTELELLGPREREVLDYLSKGLLYKEIATEMGITIGTVKQHIHSIYQKLHVQNRTEAINKYLGRKP